MKTVVEKNRLIAEFMKREISKNKIYSDVKDTGVYSKVDIIGDGEYEINLHNVNELKFHISWDWLTPVVSKIDKTYTDEVLLLCKVNLFNAIHKCNIKDTYDEVIEFIENYNKTKSC